MVVGCCSAGVWFMSSPGTMVVRWDVNGLGGGWFNLG